MTGQRILVSALILGLLLAPGGVSQAQELGSSPVPLQSVANAPVLPDLIVTDIWAVGNTIHYQLWNAGAATASAGHYTGLTIDGFSFPPDSVNVALAPGERAWRTFPQYGWTCSGISDTIKACADAGTTVWESDENNNCREETLLCDQAPPVITAGPTVKADETAATVTWQTDEDCLGVVRYGPQAGVFATQVQEVGGTQNHELVLKPLELATVYHYVAQCADASGNTVTADDAFFQTYPPTPGQPPDLGTPTVTRDEGEAERYTISSLPWGSARPRTCLQGFTRAPWTPPRESCRGPRSLTTAMHL
jgi:hypothetical protein